MAVGTMGQESLAVCPIVVVDRIWFHDSRKESRAAMASLLPAHQGRMGLPKPATLGDRRNMGASSLVAGICK